MKNNHQHNCIRYMAESLWTPGHHTRPCLLNFPVQMCSLFCCYYQSSSLFWYRSSSTSCAVHLLTSCVFLNDTNLNLNENNSQWKENKNEFGPFCWASRWKERPACWVVSTKWTSLPDAIILGCASSGSPSAVTNTPRHGRQVGKVRARNETGVDILQQGADGFGILPLSLPVCTCHHSRTAASSNKHSQLLSVYFGVTQGSPYTMLR